MYVNTTAPSPNAAKLASMIVQYRQPVSLEIATLTAHSLAACLTKQSNRARLSLRIVVMSLETPTGWVQPLEAKALLVALVDETASVTIKTVADEKQTADGCIPYRVYNLEAQWLLRHETAIQQELQILAHALQDLSHLDASVEGQ